MADLKEFQRKMEKTLDVLASDFAAVRAGRANAQVLDRIAQRVAADGVRVSVPSPDRGSQFDTVDHPQARVLLGGVQVGVGVDGRCGQRLRQPRQPQPLDHGFGHFVPSPAARAASARS